MRRRVYIEALVAITLILLWCGVAWLVTRSYYLSHMGESVQQNTKLSQMRAEDLTNSIQRNLNYLSGVPEFFIHAIRVNKAISRNGSSVIPSKLPYETGKKRWTADPVLNDLDQALAIACANFQVDLIYVVNAAGDAIAASNWNTPGSTIGTNFAERIFFR